MGGYGLIVVSSVISDRERNMVMGTIGGNSKRKFSQENLGHPKIHLKRN